MGYSPCGCKESDTTERLHFTAALASRRDSRKLWWVAIQMIDRRKNALTKKFCTHYYPILQETKPRII